MEHLGSSKYSCKLLSFRLKHMHKWEKLRCNSLCVGAIANRCHRDQECSLYKTTDLGPVRATCRKKDHYKQIGKYFWTAIALKVFTLVWFTCQSFFLVYQIVFVIDFKMTHENHQLLLLITPSHSTPMSHYSLFVSRHKYKP